ncbi:MAG: Uma2 family endonuclease [Pyrinomonadaceae bacterium]
MSTTTRLITADELLVMPHRDEHGNQCRFELIRGELFVKKLFSPAHGVLCSEIVTAIGTFVEAHDLGLVFGTGTGYVVGRNPDSVVGVDAAFVSHERLSEVEDFDFFLPFAPDLGVEVLSLNDTADEITEKVSIYFAAGSRVVWVFNPKKRTAAVYTSPTDVRILSEHETLEGGEVLPGFKLELSKLFSVGKR